MGVGAVQECTHTRTPRGARQGHTLHLILWCLVTLTLITPVEAVPPVVTTTWQPSAPTAMLGMAVATLNIAGSLSRKLADCVRLFRSLSLAVLVIQEIYDTAKGCQILAGQCKALGLALLFTPSLGASSRDLKAGLAILTTPDLAARVAGRADIPGRAITLVVAFPHHDLLLAGVYGVASANTHPEEAVAFYRGVRRDLEALRRTRRREGLPLTCVVAGDFNTPSFGPNQPCDGRLTSAILEPLWSTGLVDAYARRHGTPAHTRFDARPGVPPTHIDMVLVSDHACAADMVSAVLQSHPHVPITDHRLVLVEVRVPSRGPTEAVRLPVYPTGVSYPVARFHLERPQVEVGPWERFKELTVVKTGALPPTATLEERFKALQEALSHASGTCFDSSVHTTGSVVRRKRLRRAADSPEYVSYHRARLALCAVRARPHLRPGVRVTISRWFTQDGKPELATAAAQLPRPELLARLETHAVTTAGLYRAAHAAERRQRCGVAIRKRRALFRQGRPRMLVESVMRPARRQWEERGVYLPTEPPAGGEAPGLTFSIEPQHVQGHTAAAFWAWTRSTTQCPRWTETPEWARELYRLSEGEDGSIQTEHLDAAWGSLMDPVSAEEWGVIRHLKGRSTAPGPSGITFAMLFAADESLLREVRVLLDQCLAEGRVCPEMGYATLLPIPKTETAAGYEESRPITMMETMTKTLTWLLSRRLQRLSEHHPRLRALFSATQYAFREGRGCFQPGLALRCVLEDAVDTGREVHVFDADIAKAYDSVERWSLQLSYNALGLPVRFRALMQSLDSLALSTVLTPFGPSPTFPVEKGVRQGDPLSCWRWVIFMNPLLCMLEGMEGGSGYQTAPVPGHPAASIKVLAYADDTLLFARTLDGLRVLTSRFLDFFAWHGIAINKSKSQYICSRPTAKGAAGGRRQGPRAQAQTALTPALVVTPSNGEEVAFSATEPSAALRYLGFFFTQRLATDAGYVRIKQVLERWGPPLLQAKVSYEEARYLVNRVLIPRIAHPLLLAAPTKHQSSAISALVRRLVTRKHRLPMTTIREGIHSRTLGLGVADPEEWVLQLRLRHLISTLQRADPIVAPLVYSRLCAVQRALLLPRPPLLYPSPFLPATDRGVLGTHRWWVTMVRVAQKMDLWFQPTRLGPGSPCQVLAVAPRAARDTMLAEVLASAGASASTWRALSRHTPASDVTGGAPFFAWLSMLTMASRGASLPTWSAIRRQWGMETRGPVEPLWLTLIRTRVTGSADGTAVLEEYRVQLAPSASLLMSPVHQGRLYIATEQGSGWRFFWAATSTGRVSRIGGFTTRLIKGRLSTVPRREGSVWRARLTPETSEVPVEWLHALEGAHLADECVTWEHDGRMVLYPHRSVQWASLGLPTLSPLDRWLDEMSPRTSLSPASWALEWVAEATVATDGSYEASAGTFGWALVSPDLPATTTVEGTPMWVCLSRSCRDCGTAASPIYLAEAMAAMWALSLPIRSLTLIIDNQAVAGKLRKRVENPDARDPVSEALASVWSGIRNQVRARRDAGCLTRILEVRSHQPPPLGHPLNSVADVMANAARDGQYGSAWPAPCGLPLPSLVLIPHTSAEVAHVGRVLPDSVATFTARRAEQDTLHRWCDPQRHEQNVLLAGATDEQLRRAAQVRRKLKRNREVEESSLMKLLCGTLPDPQGTEEGRVRRLTSRDAEAIAQVHVRCDRCESPEEKATQWHALTSCAFTLPLALRTALVYQKFVAERYERHASPDAESVRDAVRVALGGADWVGEEGGLPVVSIPCSDGTSVRVSLAGRSAPEQQRLRDLDRCVRILSTHAAMAQREGRRHIAATLQSAHRGGRELAMAVLRITTLHRWYTFRVLPGSSRPVQWAVLGGLLHEPVEAQSARAARHLADEAAADLMRYAQEAWRSWARRRPPSLSIPVVDETASTTAWLAMPPPRARKRRRVGEEAPSSPPRPPRPLETEARETPRTDPRPEASLGPVGDHGRGQADAPPRRKRPPDAQSSAVRSRKRKQVGPPAEQGADNPRT